MSHNLSDPAARGEPPRGYPRTREEWWQFVDYYREQLRDLVAEYHPDYARWGAPLPITAPAAEAVCDSVREKIERETVEDPLQSFGAFVLARNTELVRLLNQTWFGIPESRDAHALPGFGVLCDLCSEAYVLEENHGEEEN